MTKYKPPAATKREYKRNPQTNTKTGSSVPVAQSTPMFVPQPPLQRSGPVSATTQLLSGSQTSQWLSPFRSNASVTSTHYIAPIRPPMLIPSYPTPIITRPLTPNTTPAITYTLPPHPASNAAVWEPHKSGKASQATAAESSSDLSSHITKAMSSSQSTPL